MIGFTLMWTQTEEIKTSIDTNVLLPTPKGAVQVKFRHFSNWRDTGIVTGKALVDYWPISFLCLL